MSRKRKRLDSNHAEIVQAFQQLGYLVQSTAGIGGGFPDLVVSLQGKVTLVEVKAQKGTYTIGQKTFTERGWKVATVRNLDDVLALTPREG